jgi:ATP-binding cassette subfamily B multidrug efflux pump
MTVKLFAHAGQEEAYALDRLVVIDQGEIVQQGRHDELAHSDGLYAELWKRQSGGFIV